MIEAIRKPIDVERAVAARPVRGNIGDREVIITRGGKVLINGIEIKGGPAVLMKSLDIAGDIRGDDDLSEKQWGWTQRLLGQVAGMILGTDRATAMALTTGEIKIEEVVERAAILVDKIMAVQIGYERGRLRVSHLDTAQATAEAMSSVLRTAATNWWSWSGVPKEMKEVVVGVLEDYRRAQAVVLAAEIPQEMMDKGLANITAIAQARTDAKKDVELAKLAVREGLIRLSNEERNNRLNGIEKAGRIIIGQLPDEGNGEEGVGLIGLGYGLPRAAISGVLTGIGEGIGGMVGGFKDKARLTFPKLTFLTDEPELAVTVAGAAGGILVAAITIGGSVVLLASGAGLGAGVGLFGIWGVKALSKKLAGR